MKDSLTYLKNEESIMIKINSTSFQQGLHLRVATRATIYGILAGVILVRSTGDN